MRSGIQYVASADGTSLAYFVEGEGPPLLHMRPGLTHLELDREVSSYRTQIDWLSRRFRVVMFDYRGTGLSQRGSVEHSLARWVEDVEAVVGRMGPDPATIMALGPACATAIAFAHRWPEGVRSMVLWNPTISGQQGAPELRALEGLIETNWAMYTEMMADALYGWSNPAAARARAAVMRGASTPAEAVAIRAAQSTVDVTDLLPEVRTPTLVLLPREAVLALADSARRVAATMPEARLASIPGKFVATDFATPEIVAPVAEFLGIPVDRVVSAEVLRHEALVILFADIVDSTALAELLGDAAARMRTADLDLRLRATIRANGGTPVEGRLLGDGVLAVFRSGREAIAAARACHEAAVAIDLALHIGVHAGDVIQENGDVHGGAVNLAARAAGIAGSGETIVTETVRGLARTSAGVGFEERGAHALKGIDEPQRLFAVR